MSSLQKCLTIAEVCQMRDGEWINDGVIASVLTIEQKQSGPRAKNPGKKFWVVKLGSEEGPEQVELSLFFAPKFREGDLIELTGKGIKFSQNNYGPKLSIGQETEITVVPSGRERAPAPQPRAAGPRDDSRGGGEEPHHAPGQQEEAPPSTPANPQFHHKMGATALFYLHCLAYARKINVTLKAGGHPEMSPDHFQACVSTLFIAGDRNGLAVAPPPPSSKATEAAPPAKVEPRKAAPQPKHEDEDEDVPF